MTSLEEAYEYVKKNLKENRFIHTLGVIEEAKKLAKINGVSEEKAEMAGLIHDIAKEMPDEEKIEYTKQHNIEVDEIERKNIGLLHAKIAANIAKEKYNFDKEIQQAIEYHTTGNPNMNLFDKIIFVYTNDEIRLKRLLLRNGYTLDYAKARINSQMRQEEKAQKSDYVINNNGSIEELNVNIIKLFEQIR